MTRNGGALMFVLISLVGWPKETTFWMELSRLMNRVAFSRIRKRNAKACNGKHQHHRDQKGTHVTSPSGENAHLVFDHNGFVHFEFLEKGRTVNQNCYLEILTRLREVVRRRRPELWPETWILHHDNAPVHDALVVQEFLAKNR
jgi:hypothetical protein